MDDICAPLSQPSLRIDRLDTPPGDEKLRLGGRVQVATDPPIDPLRNGLRVFLPGRVAPGSCLPGAPTDPDVRD